MCICNVLYFIDVLGIAGTEQYLLAANYNAKKLPKGKHSTKGLGHVEPDPAQSHKL